jgi:hypothetical protein
MDLFDLDRRSMPCGLLSHSIRRRQNIQSELLHILISGIGHTGILLLFRSNSYCYNTHVIHILCINKISKSIERYIKFIDMFVVRRITRHTPPVQIEQIHPIIILIVRVRSGHEMNTETIHVLILRTSPRTGWFEGQHIEYLCVYCQIVFFY